MMKMSRGRIRKGIYKEYSGLDSSLEREVRDDKGPRDWENSVATDNQLSH